MSHFLPKLPSLYFFAYLLSAAHHSTSVLSQIKYSAHTNPDSYDLFSHNCDIICPSIPAHQTLKINKTFITRISETYMSTWSPIPCSLFLLTGPSFTSLIYFLALSVWEPLGWGSQHMNVPGTKKIRYKPSQDQTFRDSHRDFSHSSMKCTIVYPCYHHQGSLLTISYITNPSPFSTMRGAMNPSEM